MKKGAVAGILVMFAGYTIASYGVVLLKGWDIPWRSWIDPLHAYRWPAQDPNFIPAGQVFPNQAPLVPAFGAAGVGPSILNALGKPGSGGGG